MSFKFFWFTLFWILCIKREFVNMFLRNAIADSHKMCLPCFWTLSCLYRFLLRLLIDLHQCKCLMILSLFLMVFVFSSNISTCSTGRKHVGNYIDKCNQTVKALYESLILDHVLPLACVVCIVQSESNYVASALCCAQIFVVRKSQTSQIHRGI